MRATPPAQNGDSRAASGGHEGWVQTMRRDTWTPCGKAPPDKPALKPYRGKPAVRNFRGDDGDVGIIRSPVRAIALPDRRLQEARAQREAGGLRGVSRCECLWQVVRIRSGHFASVDFSAQPHRLSDLVGC